MNRKTEITSEQIVNDNLDRGCCFIFNNGNLLWEIGHRALKITPMTRIEFVLQRLKLRNRLAGTPSLGKPNSTKVAFARPADPRTSLEHQCPTLLFRLLSRIGHAIHLESIVVEERDQSPLVAELHTGRQRDDQCRSGIDRARQAMLVL